MKTRILYISSNTMIGGQETALKRLVEHVDRELYTVDTLITGEKGLLHEEYVKHSDHLYYHQENNSSDVYSYIYQLIRENDYNIIHFFNLWTIYDIIIRVKRLFPKVKVFITLFIDLDFHRNAHAQEFNLITKIKKHIDFTITDSTLNKKVDPTINVIRNGIPVNLFKPQTKTPKTVAWVGRFIEAKRAQLIPEIARQLPDYEFTMVADRETDTYRKVVKDKPHNLTIRVGLSEKEVANILGRSEYFIFTSTCESMPLTILESMACGCCVISEDVGDIKSVLVDGVNGYFIPKDINVVEWVSNNLPHLDKTVSSEAREVVLTSFTCQQMTKSYEFLYGEIGDHENQGRISFLWDYAVFNDNLWDNKVDALQNTITRLSNNYATQIFAPTSGKQGRTVLNGQNIHFFNQGDYRDVIINLRKFNPDMIFMNLFHNFMWDRILKAFPDTWKAVKHFGAKDIRIRDVKDYDAVLVQQEYLTSIMTKHNDYPLDKIYVMPYGIRTDLFKPDKKIEKTYTGVMLADFRQYVKRQHLLIEAWKQIPGKLMLIGRFDRSLPDNYHLDCMEQAERIGVSDRIDFIDDTPHEKVPDLLRQAKIAFLTSAWEGGSLSLMEKMACGLPSIVLSDCAGNVNRIRIGVDGLVADPTPEDIATKTLELLDNYEEMGIKASERVRREFGYNDLYYRYNDLIEKVMETKR